MIKLVKLILEIKITGKIDPKIVVRLFNDIFAKIGDMWDDNNQNITINMDDELDGIAKKYGISDITDGLSGDEKKLVLNLDKNRLSQFYRDLLEFKSKHNIK